MGSAPQGRKFRYGLLAFSAALLCATLYFPALDSPLFFDDLPNIAQNTLVQIDGRTFDDWRIASLSSGAGQIERSVAMLTFAVNHVIAGDLVPGSLKFTNVLIHILCGGLVYRFAALLAKTPALRARPIVEKHGTWFAVLAALLWLLHPLHVSTVMYSVQRMAQLSTLFTVGGLVVFLHYRLQWVDARDKTGPTTADRGGDFVACTLWVALLGTFALFSKENGALLPWLVVVIEVALFQALWFGRTSKVPGCLSWLLLVLPVLLVAVVFVVAPEWVLDRYATREFTLEERLLTQGRVLWHYIAWIFLPNLTQMGFFHDDISISRCLLQPATGALAAAAWGGVLLLAFVARFRTPIGFFSVLFFLVAHSIESSVIPLEMAFEHRNYLPSVALAILAAYSLVLLGEKFSTEESTLSGWMLGAAAVLALSVLLGIRAYMWRDELSLARFNVINHPDSPRANFYYASALYSRYLEAQAQGMPREERAALAVAARQYYLNMHALDERDIAPIVMLYQLEARHFPGLAEENDWLSKIEDLAQSRRLQRSDTTALGALVRHVMASDGQDRQRVDQLLKMLSDRAPGNLGLVALRYRLMKDQESRRTELAQMLHGYLERKPGSRKAAAYLAQFYGGESGEETIPQTYEALARWLDNDRDHQELSQIMAAFEP